MIDLFKNTFRYASIARTEIYSMDPRSILGIGPIQAVLCPSFLKNTRNVQRGRPQQAMVIVACP